MKTILSLSLLLALGACSSHKAAKKNVEAKAAEETTANAQNLGATIDDLINSSTTLTAAQKTELHGIMALNKAKAEELATQSYKLRAVLIKELLSGKANFKEVKIIEKKIQKVEGERLKNTFDTVEKISKIVAPNPEHDKYNEPLFNFMR